MIGPLLKQEIESTFEVVRNRCSQDEIVFLCPQPGCGDTSGNRGVNLKNGKTSCWRCGVGGNFIAWARRIGIRFSNADDLTSSLSLKELFNIKPEVRSILPVVAKVSLPEGFTKCSDEPNSVYTRLIGKMAVRKNLIPEDLLDAGCGFTRIHPGWEPYAIFPVIEYDTVVYYQGRTYSEEPGERSKKFPSSHEVKYGARYWVYNLDEARISKAKTLIVVESILNVLSLKWFLKEKGVTDIVPVAVFKHRVSLEQFFKLSRIPSVKEICLLFDHDAIAHSWSDAVKFTNKFDITIAEMPAGENNAKLDPNDDVALAWKVFNKRKVYSRIDALRATEKALHAAHWNKKVSGISGVSFV